MTNDEAAGHLRLAVELIRGRFVELAVHVLEQCRVIGGSALLALIIDQGEHAARLLGEELNDLLVVEVVDG